MATTKKTTSTAPAKKKSPRAKVGATVARTEDKRSRAMEMLLAGHKCPAIGEALGVSRERAWQLAKEALELLKAETLEDAATWRSLLTQEHLEQLVVGKSLRSSDELAEVEAGLATVNTALTQLRSLWVPTLPTSLKQELTGANGGPLQVGGPDLSKLTDTQLAQLEALLSTASAPQPGA